MELHQNLESFLHKIESLHETMPILIMMTYLIKKLNFKKKSDFLKKYGEILETKGDFKKYSLSFENERAIKRLDNSNKKASTAFEIFPNKFLVSYVSEFDNFLGSLIRILLHSKPEILNTSDRNISYSNLKDLGSIEAAFNSIVDKEVDSVLRKSHADQFKWMESTFNITLNKGLDSWSQFIELTERRNLFVHCNATVSEQYIKNCKAHNYCLKEDTIVGSKLSVDKKYLDDSFNCLCEIAIKLSQVLWRSLFKNEIAEADASLNEIAYNLILNGNYKLAQSILDFSVNNIKKHHNDYFKRSIIINRAQSYYHDKNKNKSDQILDNEDWSSCSDIFQLCVCVLKEDFDKAANIMKSIGINKHISDADYLDWPVFKEFRKDKFFESAYKSIYFKDPVNISEIATSIESESPMEHFDKTDINFFENFMGMTLDYTED